MSESSTIAADSEPKLLAQLTNQHRRFLEESFPAWGARQADALDRQRNNRSLFALLWKRQGSGAVGLAWMQALPTGARVHGVWLDPAMPEALGTFLDDIEREQATPIHTVTDVLPGLSWERQPGFFGPRGFWHRAKVLMRREPRNPVGVTPKSLPIRRIERTDLKIIVGVYVRAYSDRPGEFWTWGAPDAWAEAERDVMSHVTATREWVPGFRPDASFVWEENGRVVGAVLAEAGRHGVPFVEDLIVEPEFHRRGIGRFLLERCIEQLVRETPQAIELAAIQGGAPYRLYRRLGFEKVPPPAGRLDGHWIRGPSPT